MVSEELDRDRSSCWLHWQKDLIPILKAHILGLPQDLDWRRDVVRYLTDNMVETEEDVDYNLLLEEMCPTQTAYSLRHFVFSQRQTKVKGTSVVLKEPIHYIISKRSNNPSGNSFFSNTNMEYRKIRYAYKY